jgi:signal transduction histidine kinase
MSKMIIEKHMGGKIYAHNSSSGAELTIELPLLECESSCDAL